jgi:hypothetical protein
MLSHYGIRGSPQAPLLPSIVTTGLMVPYELKSTPLAQIAYELSFIEANSSHISGPIIAVQFKWTCLMCRPIEIGGLSQGQESNKLALSANSTIP